MKNMFKVKEIEWYAHSDEDPRWNASGTFRGFFTAGPPSAYYEYIRTKTRELGEPPPDDLTYSTYKL